MKRRLFSVIVLLGLFAVPVRAQETEEPAQESQQETASAVNDPSESEPDSARESEIPASAETETQKKPTKTERVKALYNEYSEKSNAVNENQRISGFQFVGDFITDKLPLTLDLGAEPGEHGSTIFGILQYDWSERIASRLRVEYQSLKVATDATNQFMADDESVTVQNADWLSITKSRQIEFDLYPYLRYFGNEERKAKSPFFYFGFGVFYLYNWYNVNYSGWIETDTQKLLAKIDADGRYHQFGPMAIGSIKMPFFRYFGLTTEMTFSPINRVISLSNTKSAVYLFSMDTNTATNDTNTMSSEDGQWCSPLLKLDVAVDIFTYFRIRMRFDYSRIYLGGLKEVNLLGTFVTDENRQETFKWRYGMEIVFPSSNRTRKKDSHLWAGLYYEHQWDTTTLDGNSDTSHAGRWIFCFGT